MGDENSLAGRTQAHKHEASSSTGGFLETGTTGMTNLSQGSIIQGNGAEIQTELALGTPAQEIRVNAGAISRDSWVYDKEEGGGRIVGEICHFIKLIIFSIRMVACALDCCNAQ